MPKILFNGQNIDLPGTNNNEIGNDTIEENFDLTDTQEFNINDIQKNISCIYNLEDTIEFDGGLNNEE